MRASGIVFAWMCLSSVAASAAPIVVGGFEFATGEQAFADDAFLVSGVIRNGNSVTGPCCSVSEVLSGSDLVHIVNNNTGDSGIVEVLFTDNAILNDAGADMVVFELSGPLPPPGTPDPRERFGIRFFDGAAFTPFSYVDPVYTGFDSGGDPTLHVFAAVIDLADFGFADGALVDRLHLHVYDVGGGTKSADIAALGSLHSIPEPGTGGLLALGLAFLTALTGRRAATPPAPLPASACRSFPSR